MIREKIEKNLDYLRYVAAHRTYVIWAGLTKVKGIPLRQLLAHDMSKYGCLEYFAYRKKFRPCEGEEAPSLEEWESALIHHYNSNPHHPEYWRLDGGLAEMPERYVREMVADWLGAGRAITGSWDITKFLNDRFESFRFHTRTNYEVVKTLAEVGYVCKEGVWEYRG